MRHFLKQLAHCICLMAVCPAALLSGFGRFPALYTTFAHLAALFPGLPGNYLRAAYYRLTLSACAPDVNIGFGSYFAHPEACVEPLVSIGAYCVIGRASIGASTQIASHVQILSGRHQHARTSEGQVEEGAYRQVSIGEHAWIGAGAIVMADVGGHATVGAGAVVTRPIPPSVVAAGNPARVLQS